MENDSARRRILIADDDAGVRQLVRSILEKEGFEVVDCHDGATALIAASDRDYSLAVIDVTMPHMDGFELVRRLRLLPAFAQLPIVMLTGADADGDIVHGFDVGVSDYILKPFHRGEFVARIRRLLIER